MGTRVFGLTAAGYADLVVLGAVGAVPVPEALGAEVTAGLLLVGVAASLIVHGAGRLQAGETIFVPAASGGIGTYAIQVAELAGATVIGRAGSPAKREAALGHGAGHVVDYTEPDEPRACRP